MCLSTGKATVEENRAKYQEMSEKGVLDGHGVITILPHLLYQCTKVNNVSDLGWQSKEYQI